MTKYKFQLFAKILPQQFYSGVKLSAVRTLKISILYNFYRSCERADEIITVYIEWMFKHITHKSSVLP